MDNPLNDGCQKAQIMMPCGVGREEILEKQGHHISLFEGLRSISTLLTHFKALFTF